MAGKYVLFKSTNGQFMFNLLAGNNEKILTSEMYRSKEGAGGGIASVRINAPIDGRYNRKTATNGKPYFVLKAGNGEPIGTSELYSSVAAMETGISAVKANGPTAPVDDRT